MPSPDTNSITVTHKYANSVYQDKRAVSHHDLHCLSRK